MKAIYTIDVPLSVDMSETISVPAGARCVAAYVGEDMPGWESLWLVFEYPVNVTDRVYAEYVVVPENLAVPDGFAFVGAVKYGKAKYRRHFVFVKMQG